jgi:hypothetical protein
MLPLGGGKMDLLDYVAKINNAIPMLSDSYSAHLWATLDGMSFDAEGMQVRRVWYNDQHEKIMEFLAWDCPELAQRDRLIVCDLRMSEIRERIIRKEAEFRCYCEIESDLLGSDLLRQVSCIPFAQNP